MIGPHLDRQARNDPAHHQRNQDDVIDLARERDEIWDEIDRIDQIEGDEQGRGLEEKRGLGREECLPELDDFFAEEDEAGEEHLYHG